MDNRNARIVTPNLLSRRRTLDLEIPTMPQVQELAPPPSLSCQRTELLNQSDYLRRHPELLDHLLED